jgi:GNAT superfamily N-acetyltransferase
MPDAEIIQATPENLSSFSLCGYKDPKRPGYAEKAAWLLSRMSEGLKMLVVRASDGSTQGMIEYVPGPGCWRPILADDYIVIHCLAVGFRRAYKNKGLGGELIRRCEEDARVLGLAGVAVVTRKGPFMAGDAIFLKRGYREADRTAPDFSLMVKPFSRTAPKASFAPNVASPPEPFYKGHHRAGRPMPVFGDEREGDRPHGKSGFPCIAEDRRAKIRHGGPAQPGSVRDLRHLLQGQGHCAPPHKRRPVSQHHVEARPAQAVLKKDETLSSIAWRKRAAVFGSLPEPCMRFPFPPPFAPSSVKIGERSAPRSSPPSIECITAH